MPLIFQEALQLKAFRLRLPRRNLPRKPCLRSLPAGLRILLVDDVWTTGTTLLRTDRYGWIELSTDGAALWVDVEKK